MKDMALIKENIIIIRYLIIINMWNDIAWFNRNGISSKFLANVCGKKRKIDGWATLYYTVEYWKEIMEDLRSDWFRNFCKTWSLDYDETVELFLKNKHVVNGKIFETDNHEHTISGYRDKKHYFY